MFPSFRDVLSSEMGKQKENVCSPNGVFEDFFRSEGSESESNSSRATTSGSEAQQNHKGALGLRGLVQLLRTKSTRHLPTMHPLSVLKLSVRSNSMRENPAAAPSSPFPGDDSGNFKNFTLSELQNATKNFSHEYVIGKGGYAEVYKGFLQDGQRVAIKRLTRGTTDERIRDFLSEFGIMAHVDHPNTTRLIGYGVEGGMHLILEFSPNGSLASLLHGSKEKLGWPIRYRIALGAARGLHYLHEGCHRRIIHRDIKAANILLTEDYEPQICDFGLAKWLPEQWTHQTISKFEGTFGYLAPEFLTHGIVDEKTDVFSFGVLLLELITGRRALDYSQKSLVMWAKPLLRKKKIRELVDPSLGEDYDSKQLNLVIFAAYLCVRQSSIRRPRMSQVVQLLKGDIGVMEGTKKTRKSLLQKGAEENKLTKKLHILNRHKQIALEF